MGFYESLRSGARWRARIALKRPRLFVYCWTSVNPYQSLLYSKFDGRLAPERLHTPHDLDMAEWWSRRTPRTLHLHWEQAYAWADPEKCTEYFELVKNVQNRWIDKGGRIAWTLHDVSPGLPGEHERTREMRHILKDIAEFIHVHSEGAKSFALSEFGADESKIAIIRHPSYVSLYPKTQARTGLPAGGPRLLYFGSIRPYKDVAGLMEALRSFPDNSFSSLRVSGHVDTGSTAPTGPLPAVTDLHLDLRWIPEAEVAEIFAGADFLVLPYSESLTSGAALLAMGFGVPIIAPNVGSMRESAPPENAPFLYDPDNATGLEEALRRARDITSDDYVRLSDACRALADDVHPHKQSQRLLATLQKHALI